MTPILATVIAVFLGFIFIDALKDLIFIFKDKSSIDEATFKRKYSIRLRIFLLITPFAVILITSAIFTIVGSLQQFHIFDIINQTFHEISRSLPHFK